MNLNKMISSAIEKAVKTTAGMYISKVEELTAKNEQLAAKIEALEEELKYHNDSNRNYIDKLIDNKLNDRVKKVVISKSDIEASIKNTLINNPEILQNALTNVLDSDAYSILESILYNHLGIADEEGNVDNDTINTLKKEYEHILNQKNQKAKNTTEKKSSTCRCNKKPINDADVDEISQNILINTLKELFGEDINLKDIKCYRFK